MWLATAVDFEFMRSYLPAIYQMLHSRRISGCCFNHQLQSLVNQSPDFIGLFVVIFYNSCYCIHGWISIFTLEFSNHYLIFYMPKDKTLTFFLLDNAPIISRKHLNNLFKPILNLQQRKKPVKIPKSIRKPIFSQSQIQFFMHFQGKKNIS